MGGRNWRWTRPLPGPTSRAWGANRRGTELGVGPEPSSEGDIPALQDGVSHAAVLLRCPTPCTNRHAYRRGGLCAYLLWLRRSSRVSRAIGLRPAHGGATGWVCARLHPCPGQGIVGGDCVPDGREPPSESGRPEKGHQKDTEQVLGGV